VDPQGITDLRWSTLQKLLTHCKGDLVINFPTSGVNRNLPIADCVNVFTEFFGDVGWREISGDIDAIVEYYKNKVALVRVDGRSRTVNSLPVLDENNRRLYDLIFATGSTGMKNALNDLKGRLESIRTKDIREIHKVIAGSQKQLTGYQKN
jgi:three-Cys-motif partner protein